MRSNERHTRRTRIDRTGRSAPRFRAATTDPTAVEDLNEAVRRFEKQHIERMLAETPDKKEAARRLNIGLSSLYRRIAELGIQAT